MKNLIRLFVLTFLFTACNSNKSNAQSTNTTDISVKYAQTITQEELKEHLYIYASDEFEGRDTGTPGQKKAVAYLKAQYEKSGVPYADELGGYFQTVPLIKSKLPTAKFDLKGSTYTLGTDFINMGNSENINLNQTEIVYAGYGIDHPAYSDYKNIDVKGKIVLVRAGEPKNADGTFVISGTAEPSEYSNFRPANRNRLETAQAKGALGILVLDSNYWPRMQARFAYSKRLTEAGGGSISLSGSVNPFFNWYLSPEAAKKLYSQIDSDDTAGENLGAANFSLQNDNEPLTSENVLAIIRGSEKPDEYLVISSHLDHVGVDPSGDVFNGADDDGSGTVAVLEIAEAFAQAAKEGHRPKRSVIFLNVTGEEKGLLGSEYYSQHPVFPMEKTVANLNIDMIGRTDPKRSGSDNYVYLIGSDKLSSDLHKISENANARYMNITLDYTYNDENDPNQFYYRSDHYNFAKNNVPVIFYFNGTHADYHRPSDTPDKIRYDLLENRARLIFHTAWEIANRAEKPIVDKVAP